MPIRKGHRKVEIPVVSWDKCVAKSRDDGQPGLTVVEHSRNVAEIPVAALHDVGKVSPGFQKKILSSNLESYCPALKDFDLQSLETNHAVISEAAINAYLGNQDKTTRFGAVVGAHHGKRFERNDITDKSTTLGGESWAAERRKLLERLIREYGTLIEERAPDLDVLAGFVCVSDWIGSDETFFPAEGLPPETNRSARASEAVAACGWAKTAIEPGLSFEMIFGFEPYPLQRDFIDIVDGPGLYVLEAPMGLGKTEAALFAAYKLMAEGHNSGLYFGLPTRLTSDRIHKRVRDPFLKRITKDDSEEVRLAHGQAWMRGFFANGGEELGSGRAWFRPGKRALLMPFAVGTIDQALLAVLKVRHHFIRCFGLAGKVVILDEVHSYDVYTGTLLDLLVPRLLELGCTVIILSATLTHARRQAFFTDPSALGSEESYPLTSAQRRSGIVVTGSEPPTTKSVNVNLRQLSDDEVAELAVEKARSRHCVLCIANTVAQAQRWYREIKAAMPEGAFDLGLLHSAFPAWRRQELEEKWMIKLGKKGNRSEGCVLVATQVVEQSVDIDADMMITELAPTDMLLQRIGRLWRHEYAERPCSAPTVIIVTGNVPCVETLADLEEALGKTNCRVYQPYVLWRAYQVWRQYHQIRLPDDIRHLLESTYNGLEDEPDFLHEAKAKLEKRKARLRALAQSARADKIGFCTLPDDDRAMTRYNEVQKIDAVLVQSVDAGSEAAKLVLSSGQEIEINAKTKNPWASAQLHMNMVSLPSYRLPDVNMPTFFRKHFFDTTALLVVSDDAELLLDGTPTGWRYDGQIGVHQEEKRKKTIRRGRWGASAPAEEDEWEGGLDEFGW